MTTRPPRVSIGLPVYNGEKYLPNTLARLMEQDFDDFELIVSDNASIDATREICRSFAEKDRRVRYFRNDANIGLAANHNRAFALSRGEFFKWAAHDDDFPKPMLARFVETFDHCPPTVSLVFSHCEYIDEKGIPEWVDSDGIETQDRWAHRRLARVLANLHMYNCTYGLIRSEMLRRTRLYGLYPMSDHVLFAELAMLGGVVEIPEPLLRIRRHPGRTFTATRDAKKLRELFKPGHGNEFTLLTMKGRMELELIRSAALVPSTAGDKILCTVVAVVSPQWRDFKNFVGKQRRKMRGTWPPVVQSSDQRSSQ
jgi:glycosyltransferase involved in cell wall biosynthesis